MFALYRMTLYLKFLCLTVTFGKKENKIDDRKIIINLLTELKLYVKIYLKRK